MFRKFIERKHTRESFNSIKFIVITAMLFLIITCVKAMGL